MTSETPDTPSTEAPCAAHAPTFHGGCYECARVNADRAWAVALRAVRQEAADTSGLDPFGNPASVDAASHDAYACCHEHYPQEAADTSGLPTHPCIRCVLPLDQCGGITGPDPRCCDDCDHPYATIRETVAALYDEAHPFVGEAADTSGLREALADIRYETLAVLSDPRKDATDEAAIAERIDAILRAALEGATERPLDVEP